MPSVYVWAENQDIQIVLELAEKNKVAYVNDNPSHTDGPFKIPAYIKFKTNRSGPQDVYINESVTIENISYKMKVIAPNGHQVFPNKQKRSDHYHQMQPLPYVLYDDDPEDTKPGVPVRFAPCKNINKLNDKIIDIGEIYSLKNPGYYTAQIEISTMIFKNGTCNIDAAPRVGLSKPWIGLLKSNTISFCLAGNSDISIVYDKRIWNRSWATNNSNKKVMFRIPYENRMKRGDYKGSHIYLNCRAILKIEFLKDYILAIIDESACVKSLGDVETNREYTIAITGWLKNGLPFGGHTKITFID
jgi:hypothetical protein